MAGITESELDKWLVDRKQAEPTKEPGIFSALGRSCNLKAWLLSEPENHEDVIMDEQNNSCVPLAGEGSTYTDKVSSIIGQVDAILGTGIANWLVGFKEPEENERKVENGNYQSKKRHLECEDKDFHAGKKSRRKP